MKRTIDIFKVYKYLTIKNIDKACVFLLGYINDPEKENIIYFENFKEVEKFLNENKIIYEDVFVEKVDEKRYKGVLINLMDEQTKPIKFFIVPKIYNFIMELVKNEKHTVEDIIDRIKEYYSIDIHSLLNRIDDLSMKKDNTILFNKYFIDNLLSSINRLKDELRLSTKEEQPMFYDLFKDIDITLCNTDIEFEEDDMDYYELYQEIIREADDQLYKLLGKPEYVRIDASNIDWMGRDGYKVTEYTNRLFSDCIPDYDATVILNYDVINKEPYVIRYSHDCPTGTTIKFQILSEKEFESYIED